MNRAHVGLGIIALMSYMVYRDVNNSISQDRQPQIAESFQQASEQLAKPQKAFHQVSLKAPKHHDTDEMCLAKNIYYEAGVESYKGKLAVGQVTINRLKTHKWGDTICKVVFAPSQFSWTITKKDKPQGDMWDDSRKAARALLAGKKLKVLKDAQYYHTNYIETPVWADKKAMIMQLGQHIFYTKAKLKEPHHKVVKV